MHSKFDQLDLFVEGGEVGSESEFWPCFINIHLCCLAVDLSQLHQKALFNAMSKVLLCVVHRMRDKHSPYIQHTAMLCVILHTYITLSVADFCMSSPAATCAGECMTV